jgi:hypothetical protein
LITPTWRSLEVAALLEQARSEKLVRRRAHDIEIDA